MPTASVLEWRHRIPTLSNILGDPADGPGLADAIAAELGSTELCRLEPGRHVVQLRVTDDQVGVTLDTGRA
ncbi:hypothetical protein [Streptomyces microflavus]|uniref:hypothetical protein n=1 Tax=Streptomyces microflavus TaxID=1919 RepID=UPI003692B1CC